MATPVRERLTDVLDAAGHPPITLRAAGGGSALVLPFGARVIGLFPQDDGESVFWVNPRLTRVETARELFRANEWIIKGGDRTWVGPEVDTHIGDLADPWGTYRVPSTIDPGRYTVEQSGDGATLSVQTQVPIHRRKTHCEVKLKKSVRMIPSPLRREVTMKGWLGEVAYAGYEQITSLRLVAAPDPSVQVGIWNLIILPAGGQMVVPTTGRTQVRVYFGSPGSTRLSVDERVVHLRLDGHEQLKIGIRAAALIGRAGYVRPCQDDTWTLVVRNFQVNPSGEYVDVPWEATDDLGYAFQSYSDDGKMGDFGELEYHAPAIGGETGLTAYVDRSQVWAFRGARTHIHTIAECLLGQGTLSGIV
ncbi:MAG: hypothetical protein HY710_01095 [Candidatus Latescibacteria bacterium]|nr:hypothetical protein [Candidatus Latescibacterota bacterium]